MTKTKQQLITELEAEKQRLDYLVNQWWSDCDVLTRVIGVMQIMNLTLVNSKEWPAIEGTQFRKTLDLFVYNKQKDIKRLEAAGAAGAPGAC